MRWFPPVERSHAERREKAMENKKNSGTLLSDNNLSIIYFDYWEDLPAKNTLSFGHCKWGEGVILTLFFWEVFPMIFYYASLLVTV